MSNVLANMIRTLLRETQTFGAGLHPAVLVKDTNLRDPLKQATENECLQFRYDMSRKLKTRSTNSTRTIGYEIHCWSKRAEDRADKKTDRHIVLASLVEEHFQPLDLTIYDYVGNAPTTAIGVLEMDEATVHFRDKRNTVFGTAVDYSLETPTSLQAVVVVSGLLIT